MVLIVLATMLFAISQSLAWFANVSAIDAFSEMSQLLFTEFIVPFEVLGFLLLAALVGALYIANREARRRV